ncbi:MAG: hypothetical protein H0T78_01460, partial [Longispora sp.]|nr:hypothetical protein [Longispora sp. (in: high G+C Gram-positive bacteria)]
MNTFLAEKRRRPLVMAALCAVSALAVVAMVVWVATRPASGPKALDKPSTGASPSVPQATGPLKPTKGKRVIEGISGGYPHDTVGAVSAATE